MQLCVILRNSVLGQISTIRYTDPMLTVSALIYVLITVFVVLALVILLMRSLMSAHHVWTVALLAPLFFSISVVLIRGENASLALSAADHAPTSAEVRTNDIIYVLELGYQEAACLQRAIRLKSNIDISRPDGEVVPLRTHSKVTGLLPAQTAVNAWGVLGKLQCSNFKTLYNED